MLGSSDNGFVRVWLPPLVTRSYVRLIGFDPRGVGSSKPALSCLPNYFSYDRPNYIPTTAALVRTWLKRSKAYATACGKKNGRLLSHMTTIDAALDMDSIRAALGDGAGRAR